MLMLKKIAAKEADGVKTQDQSHEKLAEKHLERNGFHFGKKYQHMKGRLSFWHKEKQMKVSRNLHQCIKAVVGIKE